ncbi:hypothetical protein RUM43_002029, partial [Polyplax serrata]
KEELLNDQLNYQAICCPTSESDGASHLLGRFTSRCQWLKDENYYYIHTNAWGPVVRVYDCMLP